MKRSSVVFVCLMVMFGLVGCSSLMLSIDEKMAAVVDELNKDCPMYVDEITVLENVDFIESKYFVYNYTVSLDDAQIDFRLIEEHLSTVLNAEALKEIDATGIMKENDIILRYSYVDYEGDFIGKADYKVIY